jgi:hypothetical protein
MSDAQAPPRLADLFDSHPELLALVICHSTTHAAFNVARLSNNVREMLKSVRPGVSLDLELESINHAKTVSKGGLFIVDDVYLFDTRITDLTPLASLVRLTTLDLNYTGVSDLQPLASLERLTRLKETGLHGRHRSHAARVAHRR